MCKILSRISELVLSQTFRQTGKDHGENFQSSHLHKGTAWAVSHLLPTNIPSFHSHLAQERTHHFPWKNYSHCDNLSPLEVSWLASSPERGAGCLSAHLNSCECLIAFLFKNNSHLVCHYFLSLVFQTGSTHVHVPASCPCYCYAVLGEACNLNASSIRQARPTYAFWDTNEFSLMQNHKLTTSYDILKI